MVTPRMTLPGIARAEVGVAHFDDDVFVHGGSPKGCGKAMFFVEGHTGDGGYLASQAPYGETIRPVGRDLHLEHRVGDGDVLDEPARPPPTRREAP